MSAIGRVFSAIGIFVVIGGSAFGALRYWNSKSTFVTTENAYVKGEITSIAARVPGYVVEIFVDDNQKVTAKQPLFRVDPRDYRAALAEAEAAIAIRQAALVNLDARRVLQNARVLAARSSLAASKAQADFASAEYKRAERLFDTGSGTERRLEDTRAAEIVAQAEFEVSEAALGLETAQMAVLDAEEVSLQAELTAANAARDKARIALEDTQVWAPAAGTISSRRTRIGEFVPAGVRTMALVPDKALWVEANIRETRLSRLAPGDRAEVRVDLLNDAVLCATVESIAPAAGSEFALIPPDNATGNFTKIVRRFAVRLRFDQDALLLDRIKPGMSVEPRIAIGSHSTGSPQRGLLQALQKPFKCSTDGPVEPPAPLLRALPPHPGLEAD